MKANSRIRGFIIHGGAIAILFSLALVVISPALKFLRGSLKCSSTASGGMVNFRNRARTLTFQERIVYQRAIEGVYWRHRIWPKEHPDPKPSLDAVMSQAQLETKVEDYLRKSQELEDYWQRPITAEQLQAEMDRMAQHSKQPEVLRELFETLDDDPFVIAECLARSVLTERLTADFSAQGKTRRFESARTKDVRGMSVTTMLGNVAYTLPKIADGAPPCPDDTWTITSTTEAPSDRRNHTAVWTGSEMIVWGGFNGSDLNTGGRYNPSTDSWAATSTTNAPAGRERHTAVWTGSDMIVWGGIGGGYLNTGGRYNPGTDTWVATSTTNAPAVRYLHTAVWAGNEMIVWGGYDGINLLNTGGRYNPGTNSWTATSTTNAPVARDSHTAVWDGSEMIVWGGWGGSLLNTGGKYTPGMDSWTATSTINAPSGRFGHTAVWTGSEIVVWGGSDGNYLNTGGRYNPDTNAWTATSTATAPVGRDAHTAVWTGNEMIVWGGVVGNPNYFNTDTTYDAQLAPTTPTPTPTATVTATPSSSPGTGGRYAPATDSWRDTSTMNAPNARFGHTAVWTGNEMIVWGGGAPFNTNTGGRYCAQFTAPTPTPTATATATATLPPSPTPSPTLRPSPIPRPRPTPAPRP